MKALFLGGLAAHVAPRILGKMSEKLDTTILAELTDIRRLIPALAEADIVVGHILEIRFPRGASAQAATGSNDRCRHDRPAVPTARRRAVQRVRPRASNRRVRIDDDAGPEPQARRDGDGIPGRVVGGAPARRRIAARRDIREDNRDRRLRQHRP